MMCEGMRKAMEEGEDMAWEGIVDGKEGALTTEWGEKDEGRRKRLTTRSGYGTNTEKEQSNGSVAAGDGDGEQRRRLTTVTTVPMDQMRTGFENILAGGTVTLTEGTYRGADMGSSYGGNGIMKSATIECVLGDECVVDGQLDHRCLFIFGLKRTGGHVTIKRIKVINGNAVNKVSAASN